ncbi:MAG: lamin tail domain-containing protein [Bacteroidales bacterium]|nr:lamin tail domain-containing protein [Bacteroidales bacterium]
MKKTLFISIITAVVVIPAAILAVAACQNGSRPEGPCDVYARGGTPCASAHSTTRALFKAYNGPLYQVMRQSDGKTLDIGVVRPYGYADAEAQDKFCADTYCWITTIYDQGPSGNDLKQAPRGGFGGHAMGGFNNVPVADWAPVTIYGHKVYGVFIAPGMGMRWNDTKGIAVDDQAEGQYWVIAGNHYNDGCCFDYGNAETDSRDDGDGTMETTYFGNATAWYKGIEPGPWIMTDQENNLVGCVNPDPNDKFCPTINPVEWRFVTATADGEPHHWRSMGGDAQQGELKIYYDGGRIQNPRSSYDPMRKQGAILLGNGGDNSVGSQGTFYEGAITFAGTFPTAELQQEVQANIVAAHYDVERVTVAAEKDINRPNRLQTFVPGETQKVAVKFVNTTGKAINGLTLSVEVPTGWKAEAAKKVAYAVEPGQTVIETFDVTSADKEFNGDLRGVAKWGRNTEKSIEKVRNTAPVKINEFRIAGANATDSFIELYNASDKDVDISGWNLTTHKINIPHFSSAKVPAGTTLAPKSFYVFGLATTGLAVPAAKGDKVIYTRSVDGLKAGDTIEIDGEKVKIAKVNAPAPEPAPAPGMGGFGGARAVPGTPTTLWQPLPEGPVITIPAGSKNIPVTSTAGFQVGQKMAIGYGAEYPAVERVTEKYEVVTITEVGKPGSQAYLAYEAKPGDTNIKVTSTANITAGDKIRLDIASEGHGIEWVTVKSVGTQSEVSSIRGPMPLEQAGTGLELEEPIKYNHSANIPFANNGTGISFEPATKFPHSSNEPVLALCYEVELADALAQDHEIDAPVMKAGAKEAGFQGKADQYYGGPTFANAGTIILRTDKGNVADALNYGLIVEPWVSEGYHGDSGHGLGGSRVNVYSPRGGFGQVVTATPDLSSGRYPDGADADDNINDFRLQANSSLAAAAAAGATNIKVANTAGLKPGSKLYLGNEVAVVKEVGTPGATVLAAIVLPGAKSIQVQGVQGFRQGQAIKIGNEDAVVESVVQARRQFGAPTNVIPPSTINLASPVKIVHIPGQQVAGTGVTLTAPLKASHAAGASMTDNIPTPGAPNAY